MNEPYLIQRAVINRPIAAPNTRLSQAVKFDYMGSAEFEFGALPESFKRMRTFSIGLRQRIYYINGESDPLYIFSYLSDDRDEETTYSEFEQYCGYIKRLRGDGQNIRLKEYSQFDHDSIKRHKDHVEFITKRYKRNKQLPYISPLTDFWWDISNDVMFSFDRDFMYNISQYVTSSLAYIDEQKKK